MIRAMVTTAVGVLACAAAFCPGTASAATGYPWSARYGAASASGTWTYTTTGLMSGRLDVTGRLSVQGSGCYVVRVIMADDLTAWPYYSASRCGSGSAGVAVAAYSSTGLWSADVSVCTADESACGPQVPLVRS